MICTRNEIEILSQPLVGLSGNVRLRGGEDTCVFCLPFCVFSNVTSLRPLFWLMSVNTSLEYYGVTVIVTYLKMDTLFLENILVRRGIVVSTTAFWNCSSYILTKFEKCISFTVIVWGEGWEGGVCI